MKAHQRILIEAAPGALWRCLIEPELQKRWITALVDETPDEPAGVVGFGSRSTMRLREGKRIHSYRSVVTGWEPERFLALRLAGGAFTPGMEMDIAYRLSPVSGTRTHLDFDVQIPMKGLFFILMTPLIKLASAVNGKRDLKKLAAVARETATTIRT